MIIVLDLRFLARRITLSWPGGVSHVSILRVLRALSVVVRRLVWLCRVSFRGWVIIRSVSSSILSASRSTNGKALLTCETNYSSGLDRGSGRILRIGRLMGSATVPAAFSPSTITLMLQLTTCFAPTRTRTLASMMKTKAAIAHDDSWFITHFVDGHGLAK